jgi:hypothetical protein
MPLVVKLAKVKFDGDHTARIEPQIIDGIGIGAGISGQRETVQNTRTPKESTWSGRYLSICRG